MENNKIVYSLIIEDIQTVANEKLGRNLSTNEITKVSEILAEKINWYDAIDDSIGSILIR